MPAGQPLGDEGRVISGARQRAVADGPFAESKEAVKIARRRKWRWR